LHELPAERAKFLRFARSLFVISQYTTLPVAFSANDADARNNDPLFEALSDAKLHGTNASRSSIKRFELPS
jgi:hypothetical protein